MPGSLYCSAEHRYAWQHANTRKLAGAVRELIHQGILTWDGRRLGVAVQLVIEAGGVRVVERADP